MPAYRGIGALNPIVNSRTAGRLLGEICDDFIEDVGVDVSGEELSENREDAV